MTFRIERTSGMSNPSKPCEKAYPKKRAEFLKKRLIQDENGQTITQGILVYREEWFIDIETLQDLLDFIKEIDEEVIIYRASISKDEYVIEIYDDYRE